MSYTVFLKNWILVTFSHNLNSPGSVPKKNFWYRNRQMDFWSYLKV